MTILQHIGLSDPITQLNTEFGIVLNIDPRPPKTTWALGTPKQMQPFPPVAIAILLGVSNGRI